MTSTWGDSWGSAWADSWGVLEEAAAAVGGLYRKRGFRRRRIILPDGTAPIARTETQLRTLVARALREGQAATNASITAGGASITAPITASISVKPALVRPVAAQIAEAPHASVSWQEILASAQAQMRAQDDDAMAAMMILGMAA